MQGRDGALGAVIDACTKHLIIDGRTCSACLDYVAVEQGLPPLVLLGVDLSVGKAPPEHLVRRLSKVTTAFR